MNSRTLGEAKTISIKFDILVVSRYVDKDHHKIQNFDDKFNIQLEGLNNLLNVFNLEIHRTELHPDLTLLTSLLAT